MIIQVLRLWFWCLGGIQEGTTRQYYFFFLWWNDIWEWEWCVSLFSTIVSNFTKNETNIFIFCLVIKLPNKYYIAFAMCSPRYLAAIKILTSFSLYPWWICQSKISTMHWKCKLLRHLCKPQGLWAKQDSLPHLICHNQACKNWNNTVPFSHYSHYSFSQQNGSVVTTRCTVHMRVHLKSQLLNTCLLCLIWSIWKCVS